MSMTFLNPLVLIGLAAASIPLILHLLNLRKPRTIEFSTLKFLKELQQTSIRRLKLRQILLLILRTAIIILIVLTFARPVLRGSLLGNISTHAHTSVILLLDDTFSMSVRDDRGELFAQTQGTAQQLLAMLKEGDEVQVLRLSDLPHATMESPTHDYEKVKTVAVESKVTFSSGSLEEGLRTCAKMLTRTHNANKEIYILSDMQRTLFPPKLVMTDSVRVENLFPPEARFFLLRFGNQEVDNAAVDSVSILTRIFEQGKPVNLSVRVRNWGQVPLRDYVNSIYLGGSRVAQRNVDLPAWSSILTDFTVIPKQGSFVTGTADLEQDALEQDNKRFFGFTIPERINVLCVSHSPESIRFVALALLPLSKENALFNILFATPEQFLLRDLGSTDIVIFSNVPSFRKTDVDRVKLFLERGGGVMLFPGSATIDDNYNTTLLSSLNIPPFEGRRGTPGETQSALVFQNIDTDHPIFSGVFESGEKDKRPVESPDVFVAVKRQTGKQGRTIISLSDQTPFLSEYHIGEGVLLLFSSAPVLPWTDFPVKGIFAPLMHRAVLYGANIVDQLPSFTVGEEPLIIVRRIPELVAAHHTRQYALKSPGGSEEIVQPQLHATSVGSMMIFSGKRLVEPGIYEVRAGKTVITQFAVNVSQQESDLRRISADEMVGFFHSLGVDPSQIKTATPDEKLEEIVFQSRYGVELWKACLLAALVIAVIEMAVARDTTREIRGTTMWKERYEESAARNLAS